MNHDFSFRGQVSIETVFAVAIVLIFLLVVLIQNFTVSNSIGLVNSIYPKKGECLRLAFAISEVYFEGSGTQLTMNLENTTNIISSEKSVKIGENYCSFLARAQDKNLSIGSVRIENISGMINFSQ